MEEIAMGNVQIDFKIIEFESIKNVIIQKLPLFLEADKRSYAKLVIDYGMKNMLNKINNLQDLKFYATTLQICKEFAEKNQLQDLLDYCSIWNRAGVEKLNAIKSQNNNSYDEGLGNNIRNHLNNYAEVLDSKMKDIEMIRIIVDKLTDLYIFIEQKGNQIYPPQELEEVKKIINQQLSLANLTISVSDELDADLRIR